MKNNKILVLLVAINLVATSCSKTVAPGPTAAVQPKSQDSVLASADIILDAAKKTSQNAAEAFDLGVVKAGSVNTQKYTVTNTTGSNINLTFADLMTKLTTNTRFAIANNTCGSVLKLNKSCSFDISLKYIDGTTEDYQLPLVTTIVAGETNPEFGKILFSGLKANDITAQTALADTIRIDRLADSFIVPANGSVTKRFYISNIGVKIISTPTVIAPQNGIISSNICTTVPSLKLNGTCYFEITYNSDLTAGHEQYNTNISFQSNDASIKDASLLKIDLAVTNQAPVVPVENFSFSQVGVIDDLSLASENTRIYITNTGSGIFDASSVAIPSQYIVNGTTCSSQLKVGKSCFIDLKVDTSKTANMVSLVTDIPVGSKSFKLKSGVALNNSTACASGYAIVNGLCTGAFTPSISQVSLQGGQIQILGSGLQGATSVKIKKADGTIINAGSISRSPGGLTAQITSAVSFAMNEAFQLIIGDASAQEVPVNLIFSVGDGSITAAKLANDSVTNLKIVDHTITSQKLQGALGGQGVSQGQSLIWDGSQWAASNPASSQLFISTYDAATGSPSMEASPAIGDYYIVSKEGSQNINGNGMISLHVGDQLMYDGSAWKRIASSNLIKSVFGRIGDVVAQAGDYSWAMLEKLNGKIKGSKIGEIEDVDLSTAPQANQFLGFDEINNKWIPKTIVIPSQQVLDSNISNDAISMSKVNGLTSALSGKEPSLPSGGTADKYLAGDKSWKALNTDAVVEGSKKYYTSAQAAADLAGTFAPLSTSDSISSLVSGKADLSNLTQIITAAGITGLGAPVADSDAANKLYVDTKIISNANITDGTIAQAKISGLVTALSNKEPSITAGSSAQYLKGDKSLGNFASDVLGTSAANINAVTGTGFSGSVMTNLTNFLGYVRNFIETKYAADKATFATTASLSNYELASSVALDAQNAVAGSVGLKADQTNATQIITAAEITGLSAPQIGSDAANRDYVLGQISALTTDAIPAGVNNKYFSNAAAVAALKGADFGGNGTITGIATPSVSSDIANKGYVDSSTTPGFIGVTSSGGTTILDNLTKEVSIGGTTSQTIQLPATSTMKIGQKISLYNYSTYSGAAMNISNKDGLVLNNIPYLVKVEAIVKSTASDALDVGWKLSYSYLRDSSTGLNLANRKIINLVDPTAGTQEAATAKYVDTAVSGLQSTANSLFELKTSLSTDILNQVLSGLSTATNSAISATDSIIGAFGKLQSQINNVLSVQLTGLSTATNAIIANGDSLIVSLGKLQAQVSSKVNQSSFVDWSVTGLQQIDLSHLTFGSYNTVMTTSASGLLTPSSITTTKLGYLANVTSDIQAQLTGLQSPTASSITAESTSANLAVETDSATLNSELKLKRARGTIAAKTALSANDIIGSITAAAYNGTAYPTANARIDFVSLETQTTAAAGSAIDFYVIQKTGSSSNKTMRITGESSAVAGYVQIAGVASGAFAMPSNDSKAALDIAGSAITRTSSIAATATIDVSRSNSIAVAGITLTSSLNKITLNNVQDGGSYTIAFQDSATAAWDATPFVINAAEGGTIAAANIKIYPTLAGVARTTGKHFIASVTRVGSYVYISWQEF